MVQVGSAHNQYRERALDFLTVAREDGQRWWADMHDDRDDDGECERERGGREVAPVRVAPDDLEPDTLRAVIESFVLREGTDYGLRETLLEDKVAQVLAQLRRGEAHITFDPATGSVNVLTTRAIGGSGRPDR